MEDKDIMSELKLEYRNNIVYFNGLKINAYTAEEMQCHIPYGWIKTDNNVHRLITLLDENRTLIGHQETSWTYEKIFECFTFMDGKPFGVRY